MDEVRRGTMVNDIIAPGTLQPEQVRQIAATTSGRVDRIDVRPGTPVRSGDVLLELSNPDVQLQLLQAERDLASAESQLEQRRAQLAADALRQEAERATLAAQLAEAQRTLVLMERLRAKQLASDWELATAKERVAEIAARIGVTSRQATLTRTSQGEEARQGQAQVARLQAIRAFHAAQLGALRVQAGDTGLVHELPVQLGQWVMPGTVLARVARANALKAVLRIPEGQIGDVVPGRRVAVDVGATTVHGSVARVAPVGQAGVVEVDVALHDVPAGLRAGQSVTGTVRVDSVANVLFVARPGTAQANSEGRLFRLGGDGGDAVLVPVTFGRATPSLIEVVRGLQAGDRVIVSETPSAGGATRIRLR